MGLAERVREAIDGSKRSPAETARAAGVSSSAVTQWLDGTTKTLKSKTALKLEAATGFRAKWLVEGVGPKRVSNVDAAAAKGEVPLISWVQAGSWMEAQDPLQPGDAERWIPCVASHGPSTFALRVRGDSMTAPYGRTYPDGCIIFIDPAKNSPSNGDRIVARLQGSGEVTFKVYKKEDGRQWLQPINPSHLPLREEFTVLGTVIGKWEDE